MPRRSKILSRGIVERLQRGGDIRGGLECLQHPQGERRWKGGPGQGCLMWKAACVSEQPF